MVSAPRRCARPGGGGEDLPPVAPPNPVSDRRGPLDDLEDLALPLGLAHVLRLDGDPVTGLHLHRHHLPQVRCCQRTGLPATRQAAGGVALTGSRQVEEHSRSTYMSLLPAALVQDEGVAQMRGQRRVSGSRTLSSWRFPERSGGKRPLPQTGRDRLSRRISSFGLGTAPRAVARSIEVGGNARFVTRVNMGS
jgi:hypothetical protein